MRTPRGGRRTTSLAVLLALACLAHTDAFMPGAHGSHLFVSAAKLPVAVPPLRFCFCGKHRSILRMVDPTPSEAVMDDSGGKDFGGKGDTLRDVVEEGAEMEESEGLSSSFRQRRLEKRKQAAGAQVSGELRFKLLEEQASPFRRFRQFFYLAAAGSASIGTLIAGTRVLAGMQGVAGVQPLSETVPNTAINGGVVLVSAALWYFDEKRGKEALEALKGQAPATTGLAQLQVIDRDGRVRELSAYRSTARLVVLAGTTAEVTRSINLAARQAEALLRSDVKVVPLFTDLEDDSAGWDAMKASSGSGKWDAWLLRPECKQNWKKWLLQDKAIVLQRLKSDSDTNGKSSESGEGSEGSAGMDRLLRVYVIRKDGKVGARTVGPPAWPKLVKQIQMLPLQDQYGTP